MCSLVNESGRDSKGLCHVVEGEGAVGLEQLAVGEDANLAHIVAVVGRQEAVVAKLSFNPSCPQEIQEKK